METAKGAAEAGGGEGAAPGQQLLSLGTKRRRRLRRRRSLAAERGGAVGAAGAAGKGLRVWALVPTKLKATARQGSRSMGLGAQCLVMRHVPQTAVSRSTVDGVALKVTRDICAIEQR